MSNKGGIGEHRLEGLTEALGVGTGESLVRSEPDRSINSPPITSFFSFE